MAASASLVALMLVSGAIVAPASLKGTERRKHDRRTTRVSGAIVAPASLKECFQPFLPPENDVSGAIVAPASLKAMTVTPWRGS